jgi:probable HAF family extracellular repeat protein
MKRFIGMSWLTILALTAFLLVQPAFADLTIITTDLGTLGGENSKAYAINNKGQVVGESDTSSVGLKHAFIWQDGVMTDLGTLGGPSSKAYAINNKGQVVGSGDTASGVRHAFIWQKGEMSDLGVFYGNYSDAYGINDKGQVVGGSTSYGGSVYSPVIPFMWQDGVMSEIYDGPPLPVEGTSAQSINNKAQVVGDVGNPMTANAYILQNGIMTYLATKPDGGLLYYSNANSINDKGQVAGSVQSDSDNPYRAVIWRFK